MARVPVKELTDDWPSVLRSLTGEPVPRSIERQAISAIKRDIGQEERQEARRQRDWARVSQKSRVALREALGKDDRIAEIKEVIRPSIEKWRAFELAEPTVEQEEASVSLGSITTTVVPPYNFIWGYEDKSGPAELATSQQKQAGSLQAHVLCPDGGDESSGIARSGVGIFYKPAISGTLSFTSTPSFNYFWFTVCSLADARSSGALGLRVYRFIDGKQNPADGTYKSKRWDLWYDESWWPPGAGAHQPDALVSQMLTLPSFPVSKDHFYNMWVTFRVTASADGGGFVYDSAAQATISGTVPSMIMTVSS